LKSTPRQPATGNPGHHGSALDVSGVARLVGETVRDVIKTASDGGAQSEATFSATFILGGQIAGGAMRMFLIYPEGNFIEATDDNPFFQIGEHKYGKPILVRAL
jgi:putative proteasome-type protease